LTKLKRLNGLADNTEQISKGGILGGFLKLDGVACKAHEDGLDGSNNIIRELFINLLWIERIYTRKELNGYL